MSKTEKQKIEDYKKLLDEAQECAKAKGLSESDVNAFVKECRKNNVKWPFRANQVI